MKDISSLDLFIALAVSIISSFVSISQKILSGTQASILWVVSEFAASVLVGMIVYDAYPKLGLPEWITLPLAVAVSAHLGGRLIQYFERATKKVAERKLQSL